MATDRTSLIFDILLGKNEAKKGLQDTEKQSNKTQKSILTLSSAFKVLGPIAAGAFTIAGFKKAIDAAIVQERAVRSLNIAMANTGEFSLKASNEMQKFASALQETSMFGDETILGQIAISKAFGRTNEEAQKVTKAAIDMSSAMGISLETAVRNLNKAYSGQLGELAELLPEAKKLTKEMLENGKATELVAKKFEGFSKNQMQSFEGQLTIVEGLWSDLLEEFGKTVVKSPEVIEALKGITEALKIMLKAAPSVTGFFAGIIKDISLIVGKAFDLVNPTTALDIVLEKLLGFTVVNGTRNVKDLNKSLEELSKKNEKNLTPAEKFKIKLKEIGDQIRQSFDEKDLSSIAGPESTFVQNMIKAGDTIDDIKKKVGDAIKGQKDLDGLLDDGDKKRKDEEKKKKETTFGIIGEALSAIGQGAAGAGQLISGQLSKIPMVGAALGPLAQLMGKNSDELRQNIREFARGAVEFVKNIVNNIPIIIKELIRATPVIITNLLDFLVVKLTDVNFWVEIAAAFVSSIAQALPSIGESILKTFPNIFKNIFGNVGSWILDGFKGVVNLFPNLLKSLFKFDGGGKGVVENFLGFDFPFISFSKGGVVPGKALFGGDHPANDTVPALLSPGEVVLPRSMVNSLINNRVPGPVSGKVLKNAFLGGVFNDLGDHLENIGSGIVETASDLPLVGSAIDKLTGVPKSLLRIFNALREIGDFDVGDFVRDPLGVAKNVVKGAVDFWGDSMKKLMGTGGILPGKALDSIFDISRMPINFANGGVVPNGFPNDSFPSNLTSGERVLTVEQNQIFEQMLAEMKKGSSMKSGGEPIRVVLQVGQRELANVLLDISRNNLRVA